MKKFITLFLSIVIFCLQISIISFVRAGNTDITIIEYQTSKKEIFKGDNFTLDITLKNNSDEDVSDVYLVIDKDSAFYTKALGSKIHITDLLLSGKDTSANINLVYNGGNNTNLPFTIEYTKATIAQEISDYIGINAFAPDTQSTQPEDTTKYEPRLCVLNDSLIPLGNAGEEVIVLLHIKNYSNFAAKSVTISYEFEDKNYIPFIFDGINRLESFAIISPNETKDVSFKIKIDKLANEKIYPIKLNFQYYNSYDNPFTSSETIYLNAKNKNSFPKLVVEKFICDPQIIKAGEEFNVRIYFKNIGTLNASDIKVTLKGLSNEGFSILTDIDSKYLDKLEGGKSSYVNYILYASKKMADGNYGIEFRVDYKDEANSKYFEEGQIFLPVKEGNNDNPDVVIKDIISPESGVRIGEDFTIGFNLINLGTSKANNVKVSINSDKEIITKSLNTKFFNFLEVNQKERIEFVLSPTFEAISKKLLLRH